MSSESDGSSSDCASDNFVADNGSDVEYNHDAEWRHIQSVFQYLIGIKTVFFEASRTARVTKSIYLESRFLQFLEFQIKKIQIFLHQILLQFRKNQNFFFQNIDKNCKNPTSDALDFVNLALLGASENPFHYRSSMKKPTVCITNTSSNKLFFGVSAWNFQGEIYTSTQLGQAQTEPRWSRFVKIIRFRRSSIIPLVKNVFWEHL